MPPPEHAGPPSLLPSFVYRRLDCVLPLLQSLILYYFEICPQNFNLRLLLDFNAKLLSVQLGLHLTKVAIQAEPA